MQNFLIEFAKHAALPTFILSVLSLVLGQLVPFLYRRYDRRNKARATARYAASALEKYARTIARTMRILNAEGNKNKETPISRDLVPQPPEFHSLPNFHDLSEEAQAYILSWDRNLAQIPHYDPPSPGYVYPALDQMNDNVKRAALSKATTALKAAAHIRKICRLKPEPAINLEWENMQMLGVADVFEDNAHPDGWVGSIDLTPPKKKSLWTWPQRLRIFGTLRRNMS
jgi:hypothetical protein